jgi:hypothetical protein
LISPFNVTSPKTIIRFPLAADSHATLADGSTVKQASSTESEIISHNLSGCPQVTPYDVNKKCPFGMSSPSIIIIMVLLNC